MANSDSGIGYKEHIYARGFLVSNNAQALDAHPEIGIWSKTDLSGFHAWIHPKQRIFATSIRDTTVFLIGHAYNPYTMISDEQVIIQGLMAEYQKTGKMPLAPINQLTGFFLIGIIDGNDITVLLDASGMQYGCYSVNGDSIHISSHMRLIGDLCGYQIDPYTRRMIEYKWFKNMLGAYLPGALTAYREVQRILPNTLVSITAGGAEVTRFYPARPLDMCTNGTEYQTVIEEAARVLGNTMELIAEKWKKPALSLTGGRDSNTVFAATNGLYDRYQAFSYISMHRESVDAAAAKRIATAFGVPHREYPVPDTNESIKDFEIYKGILRHNYGPIGCTRDNELRKRMVMQRDHDFDVEVKSWIGETIRAYAYKYFGIKKMTDKLTPRHYTTMYKFFFLNRKLAKETDRKFAEYIEQTDLKAHLFNYDESDLFVWEMMHGGKCGLSISEMLFCYDITIPYNNRDFMDLVLRVPLEKRLDDSHLLDIQRKLNPKLVEMGIYVKNLNETKLRARMFKAYFNIHSALPF